MKIHRSEVHKFFKLLREVLPSEVKFWWKDGCFYLFVDGRCRKIRLEILDDFGDRDE